MYGINKYLTSYAEALDWWEDTKPIRGREVDTRPIGWRSYTHNLISKNDKDAIVCSMHDRPLVTYHKNGNIDIHNYPYNSVSTTYFINSLMGNKIATNIFDHSLVVSILGMPEQRRVYGGSKVTISVDRDGGNYHFLRDEVQVTHTINRQATNNVRAKFKDFIDYVVGMTKLRGDMIYPRDEMAMALGEYAGFDLSSTRYMRGGAGEPAIRAFKKMLTTKGDEKHNQYYKALMWIASSYGRYNWNTRGNELTLEQCRDGLNDMLFGIFRDECLDAKPTENNQVKRDAYGKYFSGAWARFHGDK